jgi:hypothetical protein
MSLILILNLNASLGLYIMYRSCCSYYIAKKKEKKKEKKPPQDSSLIEPRLRAPILDPTNAGKARRFRFHLDGQNNGETEPGGPATSALALILSGY